MNGEKGWCGSHSLQDYISLITSKHNLKDEVAFAHMANISAVKQTAPGLRRNRVEHILGKTGHTDEH